MRAGLAIRTTKIKKARPSIAGRRSSILSHERTDYRLTRSPRKRPLPWEVLASSFGTRANLESCFDAKEDKMKTVASRNYIHITRNAMVEVRSTVRKQQCEKQMVVVKVARSSPRGTPSRSRCQREGAFLSKVGSNIAHMNP